MTPPSRHHGDPGRSRPGRLSGRRLWVVVLAVALVGAVAAGSALGLLRGREGSTTAESAGESGGPLDLVEVSGRPGATPVITVRGPLDVVDAKVRQLEGGSGRTITAGSPVVLAVTAFDGADGTMLSEGGRPQLRAGRADTEDLGEELAGAVTGRREGSRLLFVRRVGAQGRVPGASDIEVDVVDILPSVASGSPVTPAQEGPLAVALGDDGPIITHTGTPPTSTTTQVLLEGDGPQVGEHDRVLAQYILTGWTDSLVRESTWTTGIPEFLDLSSVMPGLSEALVDQRVGSRLAVTVPPDQATGDDTLCLVVDVLGTEPAVAGGASPSATPSAPSATPAAPSPSATAARPSTAPASDGQ